MPVERENVPIYSHNPYDATGFPLLVLDVERQVCKPYNEGFRVFHWHDEVQFVYILKGSVHFQIYDEETDLEAGDCMFINRAALHRIMGKEDSHYHSYIVPVKMLSFYSGSIMEERDVEAIVHRPSLTHFAIRNGENGCQEILEAVQKMDKLYFQKEIVRCLEYQISIQLAKVWLEVILHLPETSENIPTQNHERIRTLISFIHQNYDRDISLKDIAGAASVSQTECQRCFRMYVQCAPYQYLLRYRLDRSAAMLAGSEDTVTEIAMKVGFHSVSAYIRYFKKFYGTTPIKYRKRKKSE